MPCATVNKCISVSSLIGFPIPTMDYIISLLLKLHVFLLGLLDRVGIDVDRVIEVLTTYDSRQPLLFNTGLFMVLFVFFVIIYRALRPWRVARMIFTILFSIYFYYKTSGEYCLILVGVAVSDYILGLLMQRSRSLERGREIAMRSIVALNLTVNIGLLVYFKYFGLLVETLSRFLTSPVDPLTILLPAGISFFTFRSISYIVDIYRGQIDACRNPLDYLFFLTFFPPLLAGPVVRAKDMLPQIKANPVATREMTSEGTWLIILGIIKKMVIADFISGNFVDRVFDNPALYSGFENMMATLGFTIQLYCDFSGYSDIAIGIALLLGYRFKENFNAPFKATSPTEFWHRWHISLSTWLRDYVYIPLGGNRCSKPRAYFNQAATMVIGGFWHGASWMYVIWGAAHGVLLVAHKMTRGLFATTATAVVARDGEVEMIAEGGGVEMAAGADPSRWSLVAREFGRESVRVLKMVFTFLMIAAVFMLFRAPSIDDVAMMWHQIIHDFHLSVAPQFIESYLGIVMAMACAYLVHMLPTRVTAPFKNVFVSSPFILQAILLAVALFLAIQVRSSDIVPFIYLQY